MWDLKPSHMYTVPMKKVMFFQCGIKKNFNLNTLT